MPFASDILDFSHSRGSQSTIDIRCPEKIEAVGKAFQGDNAIDAFAQIRNVLAHPEKKNGEKPTTKSTRDPTLFQVGLSPSLEAKDLGDLQRVRVPQYNVTTNIGATVLLVEDNQRKIAKGEFVFRGAFYATRI